MDALGELLLALGKSLGIDGLRADAQGCCRLVFDGRRLLELRAAPAQQRLLISCQLLSDGPTPDDGKLLLRANAWNAGTAGGWFAIDDAHRLCLQHALPTGAGTAEHLLRQIEALLDTAARWELLLNTSAGAPSPSSFMVTQRV